MRTPPPAHSPAYGAMWHFRPEGSSVFRLQWMLEAVMPPRRLPVERKSAYAMAARLRGETSQAARR